MSEIFIKIKKRLHRHAWMKSVVGGISFGILLASVLLLADKWQGDLANVGYYLLVGGVSAAIVFGVLFTFLWKSDKRIAKQLDETLQLNEKVQTMFAFEKDEGAVAQLQRTDAEQRLANAPKKAFQIKRLWLWIVIGVVSLATLGTAIIVPTKQAPPITEQPDKDDVFVMTVWQQTALEDLIEEVRKSNMIESAKTQVVKELEKLSISLQTTDKASLMKALVIATIVTTDEITESVNTYKTICKTLHLSIRADVKNLAAAINSLDTVKIGTRMAEIRDVLNAEELTVEQTKEELKQFAEELQKGVENSTVEQTDVLYAALLSNAAQAKSLAENAEFTEKGVLTQKVSEIFADANRNVAVPILQQRTNKETRTLVIEKLMGIFGIDKSELPPLSEELNLGGGNGGEDEEEENENSGVNQGGIGSGETIYGSDDMVYDPDTGAYVKYGEIINAYYAKYSQLMIDGKLPEDVAKKLAEYFDTLFNGADKEETNNADK